MLLNEKQNISEGLAGNIRNIYCRLISPKSVGECLDNIPHEKVLDMLMTYYISVSITQEEHLSVMVNNRIMEDWNISCEQLKDIAWCNTIRDNPVLFKPIEDLLAEFGVDAQSDESLIYVISNMKKNLGAVCVMYPGMLEKIAQELKGDFYIIPSSVHECLAVSCEYINAPELRKIVRSVNRFELKQSDVLSDSVYRYSKAVNRLVIDNS